MASYNAVKTQTWNEQSVSHTAPSPVQLASSTAQKLQRKSQTIMVVSGSAWVTMDGRDIIVKCGDELKLTPGKSPAVISSANNQPVVYQMIS